MSFQGTSDNVPTGAPRGSLILHVLRRLLLALFGFFIAVVIGLVAIVAIYAFAAQLPGAPGYFESMSMTPIAMLFIPPLWLLYMLVALTVTAPVAILAILVSEAFSIRSPFIHMLFGAAAAALGYALMWPKQEETLAPAATWPDVMVIVGAGLVAGLVYWLVAGRDAGFRRPRY